MRDPSAQLSARVQRIGLWRRGCLVSLAALVLAGAPLPAEPAATNAPLRSACEPDYPPFCMVTKDGEADGFAAELLRSALGAMGRDVTFAHGPWAEIKERLERGAIDCLPLVGRTPEREAALDFTFPYLTMHGAIVAREGTRGLDDMAALRGHDVAIMEGDNAEEFVRRADLGLLIHTTPTFADALRQLSEGQHDAVVMQRLVALKLIRELRLTNLRVGTKPITDFRQDFAFAVREGDSETLALLNEGLALVMADGTMHRLYAKWFAELELPARRRLIVGGDHNYPPYEYVDRDGQPAGYNVELTRALCRQVGLDVEIRLGPWGEIRQALADGEIDAVQGMFFSDERDRTLDFTPPHTVVHHVSVVRRGSGAPPATVAELANKRIVVMQGDIMHDFALKHGFGPRLTAVATQEDALRELAAGQHDCALVARVPAMFWIAQHGWRNLAVAKRPLLSPEYCYALPSERHALLAQFSEGLKVLHDTGEYRRIHEKWMGIYDKDAVPMRTVLRLSAMAGLPLLLILGVSVLWSWSLRTQVSHRTAALAASEIRFRRLFETARDGILIVEADTGIIIDVNPFLLDLLGQPRAHFQGRRIWEAGSLAGLVADSAAFAKLQAAESRHAEDAVLETARGQRLSVAVLSCSYVSDGRRVIQFNLRDISARKRAETRVEHLNAVLEAIRTVNQLIVRERDRTRLLQQACATLAQTRQLQSVWLACIDPAGRVTSTAEAGRHTVFAGLHEQLGHGGMPPCCRRALDSEAPIVIANPSAQCATCPLAVECRATAAIVSRLSHAGRTYGVMIAAIPTEMATDEQEIALLHELAGDLAFALHDIDLAEARAAAEERVEQAARFPSENPNPVMRAARDGTLLYANAGSSPILRTWGIAVGQSIPEAWRALIGGALDGRESRTVAIESAGRIFSMEIVPIAPANYANLYGRDITAAQRAEAAREAMYKALGDKTEEMEGLLYASSHDLRTPLVNIQGFGQRLEKAVADLADLVTRPGDADSLRAAIQPIVNQRMPAALRHVVASTDTMDSLINGLLRLSRLTRVELRPAPLDMNRLVQGTIATLGHQIREAGAEVRVEPLPACLGEAGQIGQVVSNLLDNAIKYRDPARPLRLRISGETKGGDTIYCVEDNGPGIKPEYQDRIWRVFVRLDPRGSVPGEGLGLTVIKRIVQRHGGRTWVESEPGRGSRFFFALPRARSDGHETNAHIERVQA